MQSTLVGVMCAAMVIGCTANENSPSSTQEIEPTQESLRAIRAELVTMTEAGDIPSMAVAVWHNGEVIWREGIGLADKDNGLEATPDTVYAIGSTAKSMTGTLAVILDERGLLDLETPIDSYVSAEALPMARTGGRYPNIQELLSMTGGIPHGGGISGSPDYGMSYDDLLARTSLAAYPAGLRYEYSNYSIGLAMAAMERATGKDYNALMREYVFGPLGMDNSGAELDTQMANLAPMYRSSGQQIDFYRFFPESAGGYFASIDDLLTFGRFHAGLLEGSEDIASADALSKMHNTRPHDLPNGISALGIGVVHYEAISTTHFISNGNVAGGNSHVSIFPEAGLVVATAMNQTSNQSLADATAMRIADSLIPGLMDNFGQTVGGFEAQGGLPFEGNAALDGVWRGQIETVDHSQPLEVNINGAEISFRSDGGDWIEGAGLGNPFGLFITGGVDGLNLGEGLWADVLNSNLQFQLHQDGEVLYGNFVARIGDDTTSGYYPLRFQLERSE